MSMQNYAGNGYLLKIESLSKFSKLNPAIVMEVLNATKEDSRWFLEDNSLYEEFKMDFYDNYNFEPEIVVIDDDCEGFTGKAERGVFLYFDHTDKYIQTINPDWTKLPVEPLEASWTTCQ